MPKAPPIPPEQRSFRGPGRNPARVDPDKLDHSAESDTSLREPARHDSARKQGSATTYRHQGR